MALQTMAAREPVQLRIFLSSPGDVAEERQAVRGLIAELPRQPLLKGKISLDVIAYDDPDASAPMDATKTPQDSVNRYSGQPADCDLTIVILWSRLGTPLPPNDTRADGTRYESGTVWELEDAKRSGKEVWIYHRTEKLLLDPDDPDFEKKREAFRAVRAFFARFTNPDGSLAGGINQYAGPAAFREQLERHLEAFVRARLESATEHEVPQTAPVSPELELLRGSARIILKLYSTKAIHDTLHDVFLKARVLRADDPAQIDPRMFVDVASYSAPKLTSIDAEIRRCGESLSDSEQASIEGHRREFEHAIAALRAAAGSSEGIERASAVGEFNERLATWLSDLDNVLKGLAGQLDEEKIKTVIAAMKERYAGELDAVERNLQVLMAEGNPVLSKCKALVEEHHGLQDVHDKFPRLFDLFDQLSADDAGLVADEWGLEWQKFKRRLNRTRDAWQKFGELPSGGANWEEDLRDDGTLTWSLVTNCLRDVDGMLAQDFVKTNKASQAVRLLGKLQTRVEEHFKAVDEALCEGYRMVKEGVGEPIMQIH